MILDFFKTAVNLKKIQRKGWMDKLSISNPESVADHSYSMAIMGMFISDLENYDTEKIIKIRDRRLHTWTNTAREKE